MRLTHTKLVLIIKIICTLKKTLLMLNCHFKFNICHNENHKLYIVMDEIHKVYLTHILDEPKSSVAFCVRKTTFSWSEPFCNQWLPCDDGTWPGRPFARRFIFVHLLLFVHLSASSNFHLSTWPLCTQMCEIQA